MRLLLLTSLIGSILGFLVFYMVISGDKGVSRQFHGMSIGMINSMSFAYIFAMLVELVTKSKISAIILPMVVINMTTIARFESFNLLELVESNFSALMSTTMSIMLIGMIRPNVIWVIQVVLDLIQITLFLVTIGSQKRSSMPYVQR